MGQLERIRAVEDALRLRILTCEAEILFFLRDNEGRKLQDLCEVSKYSHVTIHDYIRKLMAAGIIAKAAIDGDGRRVRYTLTERAGKVLGDLYRQTDDLR